MKLFIDAGAIIARFVKGDRNHKAAVQIFKDIIGKRLPYSLFYTSNYVIDEAVTFLLYEAGHRAAVELLDALRSSKFLQVLHVTEEIERTADEEFRKYADKRISYTDCTTKVLFDQMGINAVFTFDTDFRSLGLCTIP